MLICCPRHLSYGARTQTLSKTNGQVPVDAGASNQPLNTEGKHQPLFLTPICLVTRVISPGMGIGMGMGLVLAQRQYRASFRAWTPA